MTTSLWPVSQSKDSISTTHSDLLTWKCIRRSKRHLNSRSSTLPFMYFVAEYMQMSAPKARGRCWCIGKKGFVRVGKLNLHNSNFENTKKHRHKLQPSPGNRQTWKCCPLPPRYPCCVRGRGHCRPWCQLPSWWGWWEFRSIQAAARHMNMSMPIGWKMICLLEVLKCQWKGSWKHLTPETSCYNKAVEFIDLSQMSWISYAQTHTPHIHLQSHTTGNPSANLNVTLFGRWPSVVLCLYRKKHVELPQLSDRRNEWKLWEAILVTSLKAGLI